LPYATGSAGLALTVRGSSRRIMIMRFRPANIRLINRRSNPAPTAARPVLGKQQKQRQTHRFAVVDTVTPYQGLPLIEPGSAAGEALEFRHETSGPQAIRPSGYGSRGSLSINTPPVSAFAADV
jgi:hypothetical protein